MKLDFDDSTDTSSIDHRSDAANEKYKELYKLCGGWCSAYRPDVIKMLVEAYPGGLHEQDKCGLSPLHIACEACTGEKESLQILHSLLEACPESIKMKEKKTTGRHII